MNLIIHYQSVVLFLLFTRVSKVDEWREISTKTKPLSNDALPGDSEEKHVFNKNAFGGQIFNAAVPRIYKTEAFVHMLQSSETNPSLNPEKQEGKNHTVYFDGTVEDAANSSMPLIEDDFQFSPKARTDAYSIGKPEDTPYSVLLNMYFRSGDKAGSCSGTLVTLEWVLTAGHCLKLESKSIDHLVVYAGGNSEEELMDNRLASGSQKRKSTEYYPHPKYGRYPSDYDVGLVKVDPAFKSTTTVKTVKLSSGKWPYRGYHPCVVAGWGRVHFDRVHKDDGKRKEHHLQMKSPCLCQWRFKQVLGEKTASKLVCSQPRQDYGVCPGDSGGGVVCEGEVRAVVSSMFLINPKSLCDLELMARFECGTKYSMNLFMSTCPFVRWINSHVNIYDKDSIAGDCFDWGVSTAQRSQPSYWLSSFLIVYLID